MHTPGRGCQGACSCRHLGSPNGRTASYILSAILWGLLLLPILAYGGGEDKDETDWIPVGLLAPSKTQAACLFLNGKPDRTQYVQGEKEGGVNL